MEKQINYTTIICKVNGETILNLNNSFDHKINDEFVENCDNIVVNQCHQMVNNNNNVFNDISDELKSLNNEVIEEKSFNINKDINNKQINKRLPQKVYKIQEVNNGIESVRKYVFTTRKYGKVWHKCLWIGCGYGSKWSGAMVNHVRTHTGLKPFKCEKCGQMFTISCNLKNHLRKHHGIHSKIIPHNDFNNNSKPVEEEMPSIADQQIPSLNNRNDGLNTNSKLRIFKPSFINGCVADSPYAPQNYAINSSDNRRVASKRGPKNSNYKKYDFIDDERDEGKVEEEADDGYDEVVVNDKEDYEEDEEDSNADEVYSNEEQEYGLEDKEISQFIVKRKYNKKLWYKCVWNQCDYQSYRRSALVFHIKKHLNYRPFKCNYNNCRASYIQKFQLITHQMIHRGEKPYKCNINNCGFSTVRAGALKIHKIRHTGVKRFVCKVNNCKAKFSVKVSLIRHSRVHLAANQC